MASFLIFKGACSFQMQMKQTNEIENERIKSSTSSKKHGKNKQNSHDETEANETKFSYVMHVLELWNDLAAFKPNMSFQLVT